MKKILKVMLMLLVVVAMMFSMVACSSSGPATADKPGEGPSDEPIDEEPWDEPVEEPEEYVDPVEEDPCRALIVSEEYARDLNMGAYIIRDGEWYSLNRVPYEVGEKYDFGIINYDVTGGLLLYGVENNDTFISMGQVPMMTLRPGDLFVSLTAKELNFRKVEFVGYTINYIHNIVGNGSKTPFLYWNNDANDRIDLGSNIEVLDEGGEPVEDYRDLVFGSKYIVTWYEGTSYNSCEVWAESEYYVFSDDSPRFTLKGKLSKESYAIYDFAGVSPGVYWFRTAGFNALVQIV